VKARRVPLLVFTVTVMVSACGGTSEPKTAAPPRTETVAAPLPASTTTTTAPPPRAKPLPGLPRFTARYKAWARLNRKAIPPRSSGDAHLGTKQVYASKERRGNGRFPYGTVIVKEATRPGEDFLGLIATMRKRNGADTAHNDWVFVEYTRESADTPFRETASGTVCWSCHMGAAKTDYLWIYTLRLAG
jgi:cytochrome P460